MVFNQLESASVNPTSDKLIKILNTSNLKLRSSTVVIGKFTIVQ